jgi:hypothetical protein
LIQDEAATARTLALRMPVDRANRRFGNVCRISATLLEQNLRSPHRHHCSWLFPPNGQGQQLRLIDRRETMLTY